MKKRTSKLLSLLLTLTMVVGMLSMGQVAYAAGDVAINEANFPDANFRAFVQDYDTNSDDKLSEAELAAVTEMDCHGKEIADLTGIEHFTALTRLDCWENKLTTLDVSANTALTVLDCTDNELTSLDVSRNTALTVLWCFGNQLTELDASANTVLTYLSCNNNQLTTLDVSENIVLERIICYGNQLTTLDVSANTALTELYCYNNQLTTLDVSKNTNLKSLHCYGNNLTTLDVSKNTNLKWLYCYGNNLTTLDVSAVPALKHAVENGTKDTSNSDYDDYSSSKGKLRVNKEFSNIITDAPADAATEYPVWVGGTQVTDANKDDILGDGKVSYTPGEGSGTLTITGTPAITGLVEGTLIYADGIDLTINAASGLTLNSTGSGVYVNGDVTINGDASINTTGISINCRGDVTITGSLTATAGGTYTVFSNGNISIGGNVNVENTLESGDGLRASSGNISIGGDAKVTAGAYALYSGNGSVTINDDADLTTGINGYPVYSWKDVTITGNLTAETSSYYIIYVNNGGNISIDGNVNVENTLESGDGLRTPNGYISIGGNATVTAGAYALYSGNGSVTINGNADLTTGINGYPVYSWKDVTITGNLKAETSSNDIVYTYGGDINIGGSVDAKTTNANGDGLRTPNGKITMTSGVWDITAGNYAIYAKNGIEIPGTHEVTTPTGGMIAQVTEGSDTFYTVTEADGTTVAAHAVIEPKAAEPAQKYTITYTDGVVGKEIFADVVFTDVEEGSATPTISNPTRSGYTFTGWTPAVAATVTGDQTYTATWDKNSTGGGIVIPTVFPVTVKESDNGEVEASAKYAVPGSTVKLTVTPDEGYELDTLIVKSGSKFIDVTEKNGKYQFVMPFGSVTVTATFKAVNPYNDVDTDDWFYDDVLYVTLKDLMEGTGNGKFSPEITTDRAMLVTVLWRLEGCPVVDSSVDFDDVADGLWYSDAIDWASANGIVNGYGDGKFGPTDQITREQIAAILNRYAAYKGWTDGIALPMLAQYKCSEWAEDNVIWAENNGLLDGLGVDVSDMTAKASRAELAAYLARFMQNIVK